MTRGPRAYLRCNHNLHAHWSLLIDLDGMAGVANCLRLRLIAVAPDIYTSGPLWLRERRTSHRLLQD